MTAKTKASSKTSSKAKKNDVAFPKDVRPGSLIVFEWQDGAGKSTQIEILKKLLEANGFFVVLTQWNSDPAIKPLTKALKTNDLHIPPSVFDMVHGADLMNRYLKKIQPALDAGMVVLCDRYIYTALARWYARWLDIKHLEWMYGALFPAPDLVIHVKVPLEVSMSRISEPSEISHYEAWMDMWISENILESFEQFQWKVNQGYEKIAKKYSFCQFDGTKPVYETTPQIRKVVTDYFQNKYDITLL